MKDMRRVLKAMLTPEENESEEWFYLIQRSEPVNAVCSGIIARCLVIAAMHPDWPFFKVLQECKRTIGARTSLEELIRLFEQTKRKLNVV